MEAIDLLLGIGLILKFRTTRLHSVFAVDFFPPLFYRNPKNRSTHSTKYKLQEYFIYLIQQPS